MLSPTRLFSALVACLLSSLAFSQVGQLRNDFAFGVNGGVAIDRISFDPTIAQGWHLGPEFGITARYTCEKYYGLICAVQVELNYTQMGWSEDLDPDYGTDTYARAINYLQLPLLAHLRFGRETNGLSGFIVLGPQLGFALSESEKRGGPWATTPYATDDDLRRHRPNGVIEQYSLKVQNKFDYGITGGAGLELTKPRMGHISLEARYYFGLSDIFKNGKADRFGRSAHGAIMAKLTYLFDLQMLRNARKQRKLNQTIR